MDHLSRVSAQAIATVEEEPSPDSISIVEHCPWCNEQEPSVTVGIAEYRWRIHKCLLVRRSSYFDREFSNEEQEEHLLPLDFPGGAPALEAVISFCHDTSVPVFRPWNVAVLRCAAGYLGMDERCSGVSLAQKADSYMARVALRSWPSTFLVLSACSNCLSSMAEELGIVNRCLEALACFISDSLCTDSSQWWLEDVVKLPASFFTRMIGCLRSKGAGERLIGDVIIRWTEVWLLNNSGQSEHQMNSEQKRLMLTKSTSPRSSFETCSREDEEEAALDLQLESVVSTSGEGHATENLQLCALTNLDHSFPLDFPKGGEQLTLLEGIAGILPYERDALPVSFLFLLLRYAFALDASTECKSQIETRISMQLEDATLEDFLMPFKSPTKEACKRNLELDSMRQIITRFLTQQHRNILSASSDHRLMCRNSSTNGRLQVSSTAPCFNKQQQAVSAVARVWDEYLTEIACDGDISAQKFTELVEVVPAYARTSHDQLYKSIHIFLKAHTDVSPQDRATICRSLNCLKLSQETCIQAVQNELMPLRTIVQAMFMQQLQTRNAINAHFMIRGTLAYQESPVFQHRNEESVEDEPKVNGPTNLCTITEGLRETNTRLQGLEQAMAQMRKSLRENSGTRRLSDLFVRNDVMQRKEGVKEEECNGSCASSSSSSNDSNRKKKFLQRKFNWGRTTSRKGVQRLAKLVQKMGFIGLCKTNSRSSFRAQEQPSNGCLPLDHTSGRRCNRGRKKSWDEGEPARPRQHLRHHSVA